MRKIRKGAGHMNAISFDSFRRRPRPRESEFYRERGTSTRKTTKEEVAAASLLTDLRRLI